jgi:hypothetical protein
MGGLLHACICVVLNQGSSTVCMPPYLLLLLLFNPAAGSTLYSNKQGRGPVGGTAVRTYNSTRVCRATVDPQCLQQRSSDACVNMLVDEVLAADAAAAAGSTASRNTAGLAAGAAVAGKARSGCLL